MYDYEYAIFSILRIVHAWTSVIIFFGGGGGVRGWERDSRRHSTKSFSENVVVAGTSY